MLYPLSYEGRGSRRLAVVAAYEMCLVHLVRQ